MNEGLRWIIPDNELSINKNVDEQPNFFTQDEMNVLLKNTPNYVLIDAALWGPDIDIAKQYCSEYRSLFRGKAGEKLNSVAPFLFSVEPNSEFENWVKRKTDKELVERRVIWLKSEVSLDDLRKHLRRFLRVKNERGGFMYFRFYDPFVVITVFPNLSPVQYLEFFEKIDYLIADEMTINMRYILHLSSKKILRIERQSLELCGQ